MKVRNTLKLAVHSGKKRRKQSRPFPYARVARMWELKKKTIAQIAHAIGRVDKNNLKDPYHSLRNFMYRMRRWGYRNGDGKLVKLSRRVGSSTVKACRVAGLRSGRIRRRK